MSHDWKTFEAVLKKNLQHLRSGDKDALRFIVAVRPEIWYWLTALQYTLMDLPNLENNASETSEMHALLERLCQYPKTLDDAGMVQFVEAEIREMAQRLSRYTVTCPGAQNEMIVWPWQTVSYAEWHSENCHGQPRIHPNPDSGNTDADVDAFMNRLENWYR